MRGGFVINKYFFIVDIPISGYQYTADGGFPAQQGVSNGTPCLV